MRSMLMIALVFLAACHPERDNGPDKYERERAWRACAGGDMSAYSDASFEARLACTQAIYSGQ